MLTFSKTGKRDLSVSVSVPCVYKERVLVQCVYKERVSERQGYEVPRRVLSLKLCVGVCLSLECVCVCGVYLGVFV